MRVNKLTRAPSLAAQTATVAMPQLQQELALMTRGTPLILAIQAVLTAQTRMSSAVASPVTTQNRLVAAALTPSHLPT